MTDREKAVVMAYTGVCMLANDKLGIFYQYVQDKLGRGVMTHELAYSEVRDAIKEASHDDFIELCESSDEPRVMTLEDLSEICVEFKNDLIPMSLTHFDLGKIICCMQDGSCRLWTSKPSFEQREAARWDE